MKKNHFFGTQLILISAQKIKHSQRFPSCVLSSYMIFLSYIHLFVLFSVHPLLLFNRLESQDGITAVSANNGAIPDKVKNHFPRLELPAALVTLRNRRRLDVPHVVTSPCPFPVHPRPCQPFSPSPFLHTLQGNLLG